MEDLTEGESDSLRAYLERLVAELRAEWERFAAPGLTKGFRARELCRCVEADSIDELWQELASRSWIGIPVTIEHEAFNVSRSAIMENAEKALEHGQWHHELAVLLLA